MLDGPSADTKEQLGGGAGFHIIDVSGLRLLERVIYRISSRSSKKALHLVMLIVTDYGKVLIRCKKELPHIFGSATLALLHLPTTQAAVRGKRQPLLPPL